MLLSCKTWRQLIVAYWRRELSDISVVILWDNALFSVPPQAITYSSADLC